jgi:predicted RNA-binding Zn ribbon-like protein
MIAATHAHTGADPSTSGLALRNAVPSRIATVYEFLNTRDWRAFEHGGRRHVPADELPAPAALRRWLIERHLLPQRSRVRAAEFHMALRLRQELRELVETRSRAAFTSAGGRSTLNALRLRPTPASDGALTLLPAGRGVERALATIAIEAVLSGRHWLRLKMCLSTECKWIFYDHSRSGLGRWCESDICGNRERTRAYRRRVERARN